LTSTSVSHTPHAQASRYTPAGRKPGNKSVKRSSESTPTSPFMRSSSSRRAEIAGRSSRLLRRLLRGWGTPFGASMFNVGVSELQWSQVCALAALLPLSHPARGCQELATVPRQRPLGAERVSPFHWPRVQALSKHDVLTHRVRRVMSQMHSTCRFSDGEIVKSRENFPTKNIYIAFTKHPSTGKRTIKD
jgi:hypothetical protein